MKWKRNTVQIMIRGTLLAVLTSAVLLTGCSGPPVAPVVNAIAPDFSLATLNGETVSLHELRGHQVLLTFWTTKCGWCRYQMPFLQAAQKERGDELKVVAVNVGESKQTLQQFAADSNLSLIFAMDSTAEVAGTYNVRGIPHNVVIDEQGIIRYVRPGAFFSTEELLTILDNL